MRAGTAALAFATALTLFGAPAPASAQQPPPNSGPAAPAAGPPSVSQSPPPATPSAGGFVNQLAAGDEPLTSHAQQPPPDGAPPPAAQQPAQPARPAPLDNTLNAGDDQVPEPASPAAPAQGQAPAAGATPNSEIEAALGAEDGPFAPKDQKLMHWSDYGGKNFTFHFGYNVMYDVVRFKQDPASVAQWGVLNDTQPATKWRDIRLLASGTFPKSKRLIEWKAGYMRDVANDTWLWRETGIVVAVPEIWGWLFIGRTKLGVSMIKQMSGASIMGLERAEIEDMTIPIQNDGIRWMGYLPKQRLVWNLGYFNETLLHKPLYPFMDQQYAARVIWLPLLSPTDGKVLHLAANFKYGNPKNGQTQLKARPEAITAPYFLDTGVFPAEHEQLIGPEVWYRDNSLLFGGAYYFVRTEASQGNHQFQGGDIWASWLMTGEVRTYQTRGGVFGFVYPKSSLFKGGTGAFEATIHATYTNANSGPLQGGRFWRVTPTLAWYPSYEFRFTLGYGYGVLDRFGISGGRTQFFQARIQFML